MTYNHDNMKTCHRPVAVSTGSPSEDTAMNELQDNVTDLLDVLDRLMTVLKPSCGGDRMIEALRRPVPNAGKTRIISMFRPTWPMRLSRRLISASSAPAC